MSLRPDDKLLADILEAIDEISSSLPPEREQFDSDKFVRAFILREVQIIGEAAWRMTEATKALSPTTPWKRIAGMRHVLVHDYFEVNWNRVYDTARDHVPVLRPEIVRLLAVVSPDDPHGAMPDKTSQQ